ncbi:MAG: 5'/3'-nucleotidase SurE [bacterium]
MNILLTNDDGIRAPGLIALAEALSVENEVVIIAPDTEKSGSSHGLTINQPLFVTETEVGERTGFAVSGFPADCVKLGLSHLVKNRPDLVISGINKGANTGINVFYSGTIAAAIEATFVGIPAIAVSIDSFVSPDYSFSAQFTANMVRILKTHGIPEKIVLNVNIPDLPEEHIQGVRLTRQNHSIFKDKYIRRIAPGNKPYYWLNGDPPQQVDDDAIDDCALAKGLISITPLVADFNVAETRSKDIMKWIEQADLLEKFYLSFSR